MPTNSKSEQTPINQLWNKILEMAALLDKHMKTIKLFFVILSILIFTWVSFVYMLTTFENDNWGAHHVSWASKTLFYGTLLINLMDAYLKRQAAAKLAREARESNSSIGGSSKLLNNNKKKKMNILDGGNSNVKKMTIGQLREFYTKKNKIDESCVPVSVFLNKILRGILTMGVIYISTGLSLSFIDIIERSEQDGSASCDNDFDIGGMLNTIIGNFLVKKFLIYFILFCILLLLMGAFGVYYYKYEKFSKALPSVRDKIIRSVEKVIVPLLFAAGSIYIVKKFLTDPLVSFINGGSDTVNHNIINKIIGVVLFIVALLLDFALVNGGTDFLREVINFGRRMYFRFIVPIFGINGTLRRAEYNASMCNITKFWSKVEAIPS
tara:strand:- start:4863 stop:6005 length:1143 start_codon:yes stop_codon:yes gene_type:complete